MELTYKKATAKDISILLEIEKSIVGSKTYSAMLEESEWVEAINAGPIYIIEKKRGSSRRYVLWDKVRR